jgi:hypothetical protein
MGCGSAVSGYPCIQGEGDLNCIGANFERMYRDSYEDFWTILRGRGEQIRSCARSDMVAGFLPLASNAGNAEFSEFYSETLEELAISNPRCLAEAWSRLAPDQQGAVAMILRSPMFRTSTELPSAARVSGVTGEYHEFAETLGW